MSATTPATRRKPRRPGSRRFDRRETRAAFLFLSPFILGFLIFKAWPMIYSLYLSFTNYDVVHNPTFIGLDNYKQLFDDPKVKTSLVNTFIYAVMFVPLSIVLSMVLALLLYRIRFGLGFFRTIYYLPTMTPAVATAALFLLLLNGNYGLINKGLALIGIQGPQWLTDPNWIKPSIVLMTLWGVGGTMLIYLAALHNVPRTLYEAASIDGASPWRQFWKITVPMCSSAIFFTTIVQTISAIQVFDKVFALFYSSSGTQTYTTDASLFYVVYLFQNAFQTFRMGFASAMAWFLFIIVMIITAIQVKFGNKFVYYEGDQR